MLEILLVAAITVVLLAAKGGEGVVYLLYVSGVGAIGLGLAVGVPAGVVYHLKLHRALSVGRVAARRWWWNPTGYHDRVPDRERQSMMRWFRAGAAGFLVAIAGCVLVLAAVTVQ